MGKFSAMKEQKEVQDAPNEIPVNKRIPFSLKKEESLKNSAD